MAFYPSHLYWYKISSLFRNRQLIFDCTLHCSIRRVCMVYEIIIVWDTPNSISIEELSKFANITRLQQVRPNTPPFSNICHSEKSEGLHLSRYEFQKCIRGLLQYMNHIRNLRTSRCSRDCKRRQPGNERNHFPTTASVFRSRSRKKSKRTLSSLHQPSAPRP